MKKCFPCFFCYKKKKKIDEPVEKKKIVPKEPEVWIQQQDEVKRPINIHKASKPLNDGASSSNWTVSQDKGYLEKAKDAGAGAAAAAGQAKDMVAAAAQQAKGIGVGAFNKIKGHFEKKNDGKEFKVVKRQHWKKEEMRPNKIRQEKEEERRQRDLADPEEKKQKQIRPENRKKQASKNNSGGTLTAAGITGALSSAMSNILTYASTQATGTAQPSTSRTGRPSTSTQNPFYSTQKEKRPAEKKGKKGR